MRIPDPKLNVPVLFGIIGGPLVLIILILLLTIGARSCYTVSPLTPTQEKTQNNPTTYNNPSITCVTIRGGNLSIERGREHQFSSIVEGTNNHDQNVTWSIKEANRQSGTIISSNGRLTIDLNETLRSLTVMATSTFDKSKSGAIVVTVTQPPFVITGMDFANTDGNRNVIGAYSTSFAFDVVRFIVPRITYVSTASSSTSRDLNFKIINLNDDCLMEYTESPEGYTFNHTLRNIKSSKDGETVLLSGLGSDSGSVYLPGTYICEAWSDGQRLYSTKFTVVAPVLLGTVSITGTAQAEQTLTANTGNLGGSGGISYQWRRGDTNIGTEKTYKVKDTDVGSSITVRVTRSGNSGSVTSSPTSVVSSSPQSALTGTVWIRRDNNRTFMLSFAGNNGVTLQIRNGDGSSEPEFKGSYTLRGNTLTFDFGGNIENYTYSSSLQHIVNTSNRQIIFKPR